MSDVITIEQLAKEGWKGTDVSLDIALFDYGIIWKLIDGRKKEYLFYYGVGGTESGYNKFCSATMSKKEWKELLNGDWIEDIKDIESYADTTKKELIDSFPYRVDIMMGYYGHENIFGDCYSTFKIKADEDFEGLGRKRRTSKRGKGKFKSPLRG